MIPPTFLLGGTMNWYVVDKNYINYLVKVDKRVGYVEYGGRLKLHVGILLKVNHLNYYVPISSAKPKHRYMSNSIDFHKLVDGITGELYAVININNMIPVPDFCITQLKYDKIALILQSKAQKLYQKCLDKPNSSLAVRCCNFLLLEEKCKCYNKEK